MANQVLFRSPSGEETSNPSESFLREALLEKGAEWWRYDAGDVGIFFSSESGDAELVLVLATDDTIFVQHLGAGEADEYVLASTKDVSGAIEVWVGGEPMRIPRRCAVPRSSAFEVVVQFCRTGQRGQPSSGLAWIPANGDEST